MKRGLEKTGTWWVLGAALLLGAPLARAAGTDAPTAPPTKAVPPGPAQSLDFDLLAGTPAANPAVEALQTERVEREVRTRRKMLLTHQALGIATLVSLAATDIVGQLNLNDKYGGGGDTARFQLLHIGLATSTLALFSSTALLGLFAPTPYAKHFQLDSAGLHKIFMSLATVAMVAQVVLGILQSSHEGQLDQRTFATLHQVSGYTGLGAMAAGVTALVF